MTSDLLRGEDIHLRPMQASDATSRYVGWMNDKSINRFLESRFSEQTIESVAGFIESCAADPAVHLFAICRNDDNTHIGNIKLGPVRQEHQLADIGLLIGDPDCWGKGYGTEAIRLVSAYAFAALGLRKLSAGAYEPNQGSIRAFERAGFSLDGVRRQHYILDGNPCDIIEVALLREDAAAAGYKL